MTSTQAVALGALMMCVSVAAHGKEAKMAIAEKNKQQVRRLYEECMNGNKMALLSELVADEFTNARGQHGPAAFGVNLEMLHGGFPDIHYEVEDLLAEGDRVTVRWHWKGTHRGTFAGYAPTGKTVTNEGMAIFQLRDGKIVQSWLQTDRLGFLQEIGVVPKSVGAGGPPALSPK
jgi:steroid delta-isomerase-like uncharacterized protein